MPRIFRSTIVLPALAFYLYLAGSAPFLGQWDSYNYLKQIVSHQLSPLGFGRPLYIAYNILLWESMKRVFHLESTEVETVAMMGTILLGVLGVLLFRRLARQLLPPSAGRMAALAFAIAPLYVIYSGLVMTEVPMLVALIAAALVLWQGKDRFPLSSSIWGGILFGIAVGIREQALSMGIAFLWILWIRPARRASRIRSIFLFFGASGAAALVPVLLFYVLDPAGFVKRTGIWLHALPMGQVQFWNNAQASLLYTFAICPAAWLATAGAGVYALTRRKAADARPVSGMPPHTLLLGTLCCVFLPVMTLWRDADVQVHPRYALVALPGTLLLCAYLYDRWTTTAKGQTVWAVAHVVVLGTAIVVLSPFWSEQAGKMENARRMRDAVPGEALMVAGSYSPILDYYRGIGVRPEWQVLWSGWAWTPEAADSSIRKAWTDHVPVYVCEDPLGWRYFEPEYLHLLYFMEGCRKEAVFPEFFRIYPR